jgi:hypothetical protein
MSVCKICPTKLVRDESFSQLLFLARQHHIKCLLIQTPKFLSTTTIQWLNQGCDILTLAWSIFRDFSPLRSDASLPPSNTLHMVRAWNLMEPIFVSSLFISSFCSKLRRARIMAPQSTTTSTPLTPFTARRRHRFNPLPHRDPTSKRKKNRTRLQPQKW